jgi:hypothetical protein
MYTGSSIVDFLRSTNEDSSYSARKKRAAGLGIQNYSGTAEQNTQMLNMLRQPATVKAPAAVIPPVNQVAATAIQNPQNEGKAITSIPKVDSTPLKQVTMYTKDGQAFQVPEIDVGKATADGYLTTKPTVAKPDNFTSALNSIDMGEIKNIVNNLRNAKPFDPTSYDVNKDPGFVQYKNTATDLGNRAYDSGVAAMSRPGIDDSSIGRQVAESARGSYLKSIDDAIPQFMDKARVEHDKGIEGQYKLLDTLLGIDETNYSRNRDTLEDEQKKTAAERQQFLDTIGQFSNDFRAQTNKILGDGDPSNDWQAGYTETARNDKLAGMATAEAKAADKAKADAIAMWKILGTSTPEIEKILGLPPKSKTADYDIDKINAGTSAYNAKTSRMNADTTANNAADKKASDDQYKAEYTKMMSVADPAAYLNSVKANLLPDVYASLNKLIAKPSSGTLDTKDYLGIAQSMMKETTETPDPKNAWGTIKQPKYTQQDIINYIGGLNITREKKDELADALGLPK